MTTNIPKVQTEVHPRREKQTYKLLHFNVLHKVPKVRLNPQPSISWRLHKSGKFVYRTVPVGMRPRYLLVQYRTNSGTDSVMTGCTPFDMDICTKAALSIIVERIKDERAYANLSGL